MEFRRTNKRYIAGVCGGIAEYLKVSPLLVRIVWVLLTVITFILPGLIVYIILWLTLLSSEEKEI